MAAESLYEILGVDPKASATEIRQAFLLLAQRFHPDLHAFDSNTDNRFKEIREAYEILHSPKNRAIYDKQLNLHAGDGFRKYLDADFRASQLRAATFHPILLNEFRFPMERLLFLLSGVVAGLTLAFVWYLVQGERMKSGGNSSDHAISTALEAARSERTEEEQKYETPSVAPQIKFEQALKDLKKGNETVEVKQSVPENDRVFYAPGTAELEVDFQPTETHRATLPMPPSPTYDAPTEVSTSDDFPSPEAPGPMDPMSSYYQNPIAIPPSIHHDPSVAQAVDISHSFDLQRSVWQTTIPTSLPPVPSQRHLSNQSLQYGSPTTQTLLPSSQYSAAQYPTGQYTTGQNSMQSSGAYPNRLNGVPTFSQSNYSGVPTRSSMQSYQTPLPMHEPSRMYSTGSVIPQSNDSTASRRYP